MYGYYGQPIAYQPYKPVNQATYQTNYTPQIPTTDTSSLTTPGYQPFQPNAYQEHPGYVEVPCYKCSEPSKSRCGVKWQKYDIMEGCDKFVCDEHNYCDQWSSPFNIFLSGAVCEECLKDYQKLMTKKTCADLSLCSVILAFTGWLIFTIVQIQMAAI